MGISLSMLPFLDLCFERGVLPGPFTALGSQVFHEAEAEIQLFAQESGYHNLLRDSSVRSLLRDRYSIADYVDVDINDEAALKLDLNAPLPVEMRNSAMTVANVGTAEHVFDLARVFRNVHELVKTGGTIIHIAPVSWYEHGFFNFNPAVFKAVARANGYRLAVEAFHFASTSLAIPGGAGPRVRVTFDGTGFTSARRILSDAFCAAPLPSRTLYMVAYVKLRDAEFVIPYDTSGFEDTFPIGALETVERLRLAGPFYHESGHAWYVELPGFEELGDHSTEPSRSAMILLEDGRALRPRHAVHEDIRRLGSGRYSHWTSYLIFSTSDNSDPNENGRSYEIAFPDPGV